MPISNQACNVGFWHIASFRCAAKLVGYWTNNGHRATSLGDPKADIGILIIYAF